MDNYNELEKGDAALYNSDLAPTPVEKKNWNWFDIFNVWVNDVQSLFGYSLAASLFITYGLNGWAVLLAIILASFIIMFLVNLSGKPSVKYGIPYPVFARASMGVKGANFPAMIRAIVAIFWYGVQTYFAATAISLLLYTFFDKNQSSTFLGMNFIEWISYFIVAGFQIYLFLKGINFIKKFLNFAGPFVYIIMFILMIIIFIKSEGKLLDSINTIFKGTGDYSGSNFSAFMSVLGTMVAYFAAVVINFGDFGRFVKNDKQMKIGNFLGLPINVAIFSIISLFVTAGTIVIFGEAITNPSDIVEKVDSTILTLVAAITFFAATIGINLVANFIPPVYDLANLMPRKINFRIGGIIIAIISFIIGALWVSFISKIGISAFVNTLGAVLAPMYGIMISDYYLLKKQKLNVEELFSIDKNGQYFYTNGWNIKAIITFFLASTFSISVVWLPLFNRVIGDGFAWLIGAFLGAIIYYGIMPKSK